MLSGPNLIALAELGYASRPADLDFREGRCHWGHTLHSATFRGVPLPKRGWLDFRGRKLDTLEKARRVQFMVHVGGSVQIGATVRWTAKGGDVAGVLVEYEQFRDPRDMYTLTVEVRDRAAVSTSPSIPPDEAQRMTQGLIP